MPTEKRPNLFIIGAQKAGTSALAGWLSQHPEVCMAFPKEPGFLAFGEKGYWFPDGYGRTAPANDYVVRSHQAYLDLFADATDKQHIRGDASTWYLPTPGMAEKLHAYSPDAHIIVIFRNPVERAYSAWCHARAADIEPCETLAEALKMESARGEVEFLLRYHRMGMYAQALQSYQAKFTSDRIHVFFYEDMREDPLSFWQSVCASLNIDAQNEPPFDHHYNRSGRPRSQLLQGLMRSHRLKTFVRSILPYRLALKIKGHIDKANLTQFPPLDEKTRQYLLDFYRADIGALELQTGRDLEAWRK